MRARRRTGQTSRQVCSPERPTAWLAVRAHPLLPRWDVTGCNRRTDDTDRPLDARDDEEISYDRFDRFDRFLTVFDRFVAVLCATDLSEEELIADRRLLSRTSVR